MNPQFRHGIIAVSSNPPDYWKQSDHHRTLADWHGDHAEHLILEGEQVKGEHHREASTLHAQASFHYDRANYAHNKGQTAFAQDHARRGKEAGDEAKDYVVKNSLTSPDKEVPGPANVLGEFHGEGTKVGAA